MRYFAYFSNKICAQKNKKAQSGHTEGVPKSVGKPSSFLKRNDCPAANLFHGTQRFSSNFVGFLFSSKMRKLTQNIKQVLVWMGFFWAQKRENCPNFLIKILWTIWKPHSALCKKIDQVLKGGDS